MDVRPGVYWGYQSGNQWITDIPVIVLLFTTYMLVYQFSTHVQLYKDFIFNSFWLEDMLFCHPHWPLYLIFPSWRGTTVYSSSNHPAARSVPAGVAQCGAALRGVRNTAQWSDGEGEQVEDRLSEAMRDMTWVGALCLLSYLHAANGNMAVLISVSYRKLCFYAGNCHT